VAILSKKEDLKPIFKIGDNITLSHHKIYGIVFNDDKGYLINRFLVLGGLL